MKGYGNKGNSIALVSGAAVGAVLTALSATVVFGLGTGMAGAALVVLIIIVAALSGWYAGMQQQAAENNNAAYMKGYHEGLKKKTLVMRQPGCSISVRMPDTGAPDEPDA
ncbi:MAG: hypothetical protein NC331_16720 [Lachnospiraceae bacterium]|nr:hypothetical protein [Lachnospiraceae bacterium]MCM1240995.1 hypothetical protein [Lachnospiraceae bacterium]